MAKSISSLELPLRARPAETTLTDWLYAELRAAILDGRLKRGVRLPSTRDFSLQHGVSRGIAMLVIEQLRDEGYLMSRTGAGTWVNEKLPDDLSLSEQVCAPAGQGKAKALLPTARERLRPFQASDPEVNLFPIDVWSRLTSRQWRHATKSLLGSGDIAGYAPLRNAIAEYLGTSRGVQCSPSQIVVMTGTQQSLDLTARLLIRPGDAAWMEDPGYSGATRALRNAGAKIIPVPVDAEGMNVAKGRQLAPQAKMAYVTPAHQFPLGSTMTLERRIALLRWASSAGSIIVEDDYDSEFRFTGVPIPALQGLDEAESVIFIGSFNKVLFPSLRLGYMVVPDRLMDRVLRLRFETDLWPTSINQAVLADFIVEGHLGRYIRRMREIYAERLIALQYSAAKHLGDALRLSGIQAGLTTAAFYRAPIDSIAFERMAASHGIDASGLDRYSLRKQKKIPGVLLGFAAFEPRAIDRGMQKLAAMLEEY
ncbi:MAG: Transcriptional regulator, GntR family domain / Aspartate aminotransferase [Edaphobacter sp.]|nr:Transcriptional regulator, GntR family domain / Aspartate aminotransferase [Edaphobacter sp.]